MAMDLIRNGWFSEISDQWPGQCTSLQVEEVLFHEKSQFQDVMVIKSKFHGNVLLLDGVIQLTERDEWSYQEMAAHIPLNSHPNPEKVLIIGGGDGGVARELDKDPRVKHVTMCEIDNVVIEASKKYLPTLAKGFSSPKLNLLVGDGFAYMSEHKNEFDVIITDSSDPVGPAVSLFQKPYYELMKNALRPGGILCSQGETLWLYMDLIRDMQVFCKELFPVADYAFISTPSYPCGSLGLTLCSLDPATNFKEPVHKLSDQQVDAMGLQFYNTDMHRAAFVLPTFARKVLNK